MQTLFCAEAMGAAVHVAATSRGTHLRLAKSCHAFSLIDLDGNRDVDGQAAVLDKMARDFGADIIVPGDLASMRHLIDVKSALKTPTIPLPDRDLFDTLDNKFAFAELLTSIGCPTPKTVYLGRPSQISVALLELEIGFPMVIKPTDQGNSNGVVICRTADDVVNRITENPLYPYENLIAQEYIPGTDVDLSVVAVNGKVVASGVQRKIGKTIHFYDDPAFLAAGEKIIAATGYSGPAHFDGRRDERDGTIKFIECNPRFWASITASLHCGVNFVGEAVNFAFAAAPEPAPQVKPGCYTAPTPMILALIRNPFSRKMWSAPNRAGLWQALRNFMPYMAEEWRALRRQGIERRRLSGAPTQALRPVKS